LTRSKKENSIVSVTTNGTALANKEVQRICSFYDISLLVSLDGPSKIHDRYRRNIVGRGTFELIKDGLKTLAENYPDYYRKQVSFSITLAPPLNLANIRSFFASEPLFTIFALF
jgi:uncharacterized protein